MKSNALKRLKIKYKHMNKPFPPCLGLELLMFCLKLLYLKRFSQEMCNLHFPKYILVSNHKPESESLTETVR